MTNRSLTPYPHNMPTSPATARAFARITRPILTLSGPRAKTEAEIIAAASRESSMAGAIGAIGATGKADAPQNRSQTSASPRRKFAPPLAIRQARADFALDYSFQRTPKKD